MEKSRYYKILVVAAFTGIFLINGLFCLSLSQDRGFSFFRGAIPNTDPADYPDPRSFQLTLEERGVSVTKYDHLIRAASKKYSLDPALVKAVIHAESRFDPQAVSPKGAMGLMQLDPLTVKELQIKDPFNPKHNIYGGVKYLRELLDTFEGNKHLALAAYNAGPNRVHRHKGVPPFKDTKKYLAKVFRYLDYYRQSLFSSKLS